MRKLLHLVPVLASALLASAAVAQQPTIKIGSVLALTGVGAAIATSAVIRGGAVIADHIHAMIAAPIRTAAPKALHNKVQTSHHHR